MPSFNRRNTHRKRIGRRARGIEAADFFNLLTGPELLETTELHLPEHRERLYPPTVALSMFMRQVLNADGSCQKAVNGWAAQRAADGLGVQSIRTGAYCKARQRLPVAMVTALTHATGRLLSARAKAGWHWRGRVVKRLDGTGISMPDTEENQARYRQPSSQAEGVGFPLARFVGVICLATGALIDAAIGPHAGKGSSELGLLRRLGAAFSPGDVMLADALYCNYFLIATLIAAGVDVLFEQHGARITDFRRGESLGRRDHRVRWPKPKTRPHWMTAQQYAAFADELTVREVQVDGQVLVTSLLDHRQVRKSELDRLYARRWNVGVSSQGHVFKPVQVRPRLKDSDLVAWEAPWRESKTVEPSGNMLGKEDAQSTRLQHEVNADVASSHDFPVAETVYNERRQQEPGSRSPMRRFSPAGYLRA